VKAYATGLFLSVAVLLPTPPASASSPAPSPEPEPFLSAPPNGAETGQEDYSEYSDRSEYGELIPVLPLGAGLASIGLGLAFLGLRLRQR
jgi:hypothetical protein